MTFVLRLLSLLVQGSVSMYDLSRQVIAKAELFPNLGLKILSSSDPNYCKCDSPLCYHNDNVGYTEVGPTSDRLPYTFEIPVKELLAVPVGHITKAKVSADDLETFDKRLKWLVRFCIDIFASQDRVYFGPGVITTQDFVFKMTPPESEFPCLIGNESS